MAEGPVGEGAVQFRRLLHALGARHEAKRGVIQSRALAVQEVEAIEAQVVLALQAVAQRGGEAVDAVNLAVGKLDELKAGVAAEMASPVRLHLLEFLHVLVQYLGAFPDIGNVDALRLPVAPGEHLQLRLQAADEEALFLDVVPEDVGDAADVLWADQGVLVVLRLDARRLVRPQQSVDADLHHLLVTRLPTKLRQLLKVAVEWVLPHHLPAVRMDVAHYAPDALVARPRLRELGLGEGLHEPAQGGVVATDADVVSPLIQGRDRSVAHERGGGLQFHQCLLGDGVVDPEEHVGIVVQFFEGILLQARLEEAHGEHPEVI
mmetsp:Transcript_110174/g.310695  ORF Transcript_110174/g.310695 Transcript_110174/m.310695 type:complete len:320 (-) Transcript_110174:315-1274(-)